MGTTWSLTDSEGVNMTYAFSFKSKYSKVVVYIDLT